MSNFADAIRAGMDAGQVALAQGNEIKAVLVELRDAVEAVTEGKITIELKKSVSKNSDIFLANLATFFNQKTYTAIVLKNIEHLDIPTREIAIWRQDTVGYPCHIIIGPDEFVCNDKVSLTKILGNLLANSNVGIEIQRLITEKPKSNAGKATVITSGNKQFAGGKVANKSSHKVFAGQVLDKSAEAKRAGKTGGTKLTRKADDTKQSRKSVEVKLVRKIGASTKTAGKIATKKATS